MIHVCIYTVLKLVYVYTYAYVCTHIFTYSLPGIPVFAIVYTQIVEWLLKYTNRLPSDAECQKCPVRDDLDEVTRSDLLHNRTKCLELIMKVCVCHCPLCDVCRHCV